MGEGLVELLRVCVSICKAQSELVSHSRSYVFITCLCK